MPSVLIEIPFKEYAELFSLKSDDFMKVYTDVKRDLLLETRREFDNYRVRAGVTHKGFIKTIYISDQMHTLRVMIPDDIPSPSNKKIITLTKFGTPMIITMPLTTDKMWISNGITKNTFLTRIETKYTAILLGELYMEKVRRTFL